MNGKAILAFSGDPITYGHVDIVERALKVFKHVTVGIGVNPDKKYTFTLEQRLEMAQKVLEKFKGQVNVVAFEGLLVDFAYEQQIGTIIRGVRNSADVNYEQILHEVNKSQDLGVDTFVLFTNQKLSHVSSSAAKELQKHNAKNVLDYVPLYVKKRLEQVVSNQHILGVTGEIGAGKSYIAHQLIKHSDEYGLEVHNIDLDSLGHYILESSKEPYACEARAQLIALFGEDVIKDGSQALDDIAAPYIDPKLLGKYLWGYPEGLKDFNRVMYEPMLLLYRKSLRGKKGLILLNSALLAEAEITHLCNNNVLIVGASPKVRLKRLLKRGYSSEEAKKRMSSQLDVTAKKEAIERVINRDGCGRLIEFDNSNEKASNKIFKSLLIDVSEGFGYANL